MPTTRLVFLAALVLATLLPGAATGSLLPGSDDLVDATVQSPVDTAKDAAGGIIAPATDLLPIGTQLQLPVQIPLKTTLLQSSCTTCLAASAPESQEGPSPVAVVGGGVAAAAGATGLAWILWSWLGRGLSLATWPLSPLFSRLQGHDVETHPARARILAFVAANPGACLLEVRHAAGLAWGTTHYHVRRLEAAGLLVARPAGGRHRLWCAGARPEGLVRGVPADRVGTDLARLVHARPGLAQADLAKASGLGASAVCKRLRKLQDAGLLVATRMGHEVRYAATGELERALADAARPRPALLAA